MLFEDYVNEPYSDFSDPENAARFRAALSSVEGALGRDYPLVIGGERVETGDWIVSTDPCAPDRVVGRSAAAGKEHIEAAFEAAGSAYREWSRWDMAARARTLIKLAAVMRRRKYELSAWEVYEAAKTWTEAEADVAEGIDFAEYYAREALRLADPLVTHHHPGEENTTFLIPMGTGVVIPPWNFLLAILVGTTVGPAVAGNTVIVKPSPSTPIIAQIFMECVEEAGFPPGVINLLTGEDAVLGDALVEHPKTRFINFTGSVATGLRIHEKAAKVQPGQNHLKRVYAEMGGKDALIVDETADLDYAAQEAVKSGYGFQGQKCSAMSRLIVVEDVYDEFLAKFAERVSKLEVGDAVENPDMAAVIHEKSAEKILHYIEIGKQEARLVTGGNRIDRPGHFIEPTVFADVPQGATIACEEIFGPVVAVMKAKDFDHALEIANGTMFALTGGLITARRDRIERARREMHVGNLYVNRKITGALVGVQPFGGFNLSGSNAKAGGPDYLRLFMEAKTVTERF